MPGNKEKARVRNAEYRKAHPDYFVAYRASHREQTHATIAKWRAAHPEKERSYSAAYRARNPEKTREQQRASRLANPEKWRARNAEYYANNAEKMSVRNAAWQRANPERMRQHRAMNDAKRRAAKNGSYTNLTKGERAAVEEIYRQCRLMTKLTGEKYHVDHKIALAKGGLHHPDNLQILTAIENLKKGARG